MFECNSRSCCSKRDILCCWWLARCPLVLVTDIFVSKSNVIIMPTIFSLCNNKLYAFAFFYETNNTKKLNLLHKNRKNIKKILNVITIYLFCSLLVLFYAQETRNCSINFSITFVWPLLAGSCTWVVTFSGVCGSFVRVNGRLSVVKGQQTFRRHQSTKFCKI